MRPADQFPPIVLTATDHDRLSALVEAVSERLPDVYEYLTVELERAAVIDAGELVTTVVTMGARVAFRDEVTGQERTVTLVYPRDADLAAGRVSVLTPIGAALIGVAEGQSITWYTREGEAKTLTVLAVEPPIADGDAVAA
ncbi:nucleoside diphosphate kinase regulator [Azospirillum sp. INR13]|uniref:nucleoside diphosphate kinase regulator n=1 Tax=Azospirillum sp. INR13 TaxID=2596919 RepID=UPI002103D6AF|nr:nucleoside diphosphate kinase regulator [Azospirillum sp. INR13]